LYVEEVFKETDYPNQRIYFADGLLVLDHLYASEDRTFIILSDINLPKLNGLELRRKLHTDAELSLKCIPYVFFTTAINQQAVLTLTAQLHKAFL